MTPQPGDSLVGMLRATRPQLHGYPLQQCAISMLEAAQTPRPARRAAWTKICRAATLGHALWVHRQRLAVRLLKKSRGKECKRNGQFTYRQHRAAAQIDGRSTTAHVRHHQSHAARLQHRSAMMPFAPESRRLGIW